MKFFTKDTTWPGTPGPCLTLDPRGRADSRDGVRYPLSEEDARELHRELAIEMERMFGLGATTFSSESDSARSPIFICDKGMAFDLRELTAVSLPTERTRGMTASPEWFVLILIRARGNLEITYESKVAADLELKRIIRAWQQINEKGE